jgi:uncharacterized membrane protein
LTPLHPSWWLPFAFVIAPWWLACAALGVLALPLTLRAFRGLADSGAGLSIGVGVMLTSWLAWAAAHVGVPHTRPYILGAAFALLLASFVPWWRRRRRLRRMLRATAVPFLVSQLLFAVGFAYFCNVRSYVPWATFDVGLSGAEKAGNFMHLTSAMRSTSMPPADAWFMGEPTNYYYGGHVLVAMLAKLTRTPPRIAFNCGLATIFALSLSMGFSLTYSMVTRRGPRPGRRGLPWHRGMTWGLVGGLAIAVFGNLDAWRQLGKRDPSGALAGLEWRLRNELVRTSDPARRGELQQQIDGIASAGPERKRWSLENLKQVDYWASSRAILGAPPGVTEPFTITEFPYFSAMLGDLHPHHMALPYTIAALAACLTLWRASAGARALTEARWLARSAVPAAAMGVAIGAVFPVNIWDSIVLSVLYLLIIAASRRAVDADTRWGLVLSPVVAFALTWAAALAANVWVSLPVFGMPPLHVLAVAIATLWPRRPAALVAGAALAAAGAIVAGVLSHAGVPAILLAAPRDAAILALSAWTAGVVAARAGRRAAWVLGALGAYAAVGALALSVASPFLLTFRSPLGASAPLLERALPPVLAGGIVHGPGSLAARLWAASLINPFPSNLRSTLTDYLAHWGLFVLPLTAFVLYWLARFALERPRLAAVIAGASALTLALVFPAMDGYWVGPLALAVGLACLILAFAPRSRVEAPALLFAATGFFWSWFVEALHFDDSYGGNLERYNTPFKIFYPLWPMFVAAALGALARMSPRRPTRAVPFLSILVSPGVTAMALVAALVGWLWVPPSGVADATILIAASILLATLIQAGRRFLGRGPTTDAVAVAAVAPFVVLGLLYPFAATMVRTRSFFTEPIEGTWMDDPAGERIREFYTVRTLDALAWLGQTRKYADDLPAIEWLAANAAPGSVVLEAPSHGAYTPEGRVASMTGVPTLVGWRHHQNQWRGWGRPMPPHLQRRLLDDFATQLPPVDVGAPIDRTRPLDLYRASLDSEAALRAKLRELLPGADGPKLDALAGDVVAQRDRTLTAVALTDKLVQRMDDLWHAARVDDEVTRLLRLYRIRYIFAGTLEHEAYPATVDTFAVFPRVFAHGTTSIYEVPAEIRNMPSR